MIELEVPIFNKIEVDKIKLEAIKTKEKFFIKLKIDDKQIFSKKFDNLVDFQKTTNIIIDKLDEIVDKYYLGTKEEFEEVSNDFFEFIKTI